MADVEPGEMEVAADAGRKPQDIVNRWEKEIGLADKAEKGWRDEVKRIMKIYQPSKKGTGKRRTTFNILYSNTQTIAPALYTKTPRPDVRRRFRDEDKDAADASEVLTRGLSFSMDVYPFDEVMRQTVQDLLLSGRGIGRVRYTPHFRDAEPQRIDLVPAGRDDVGLERWLMPDGSEPGPGVLEDIEGKYLMVEDDGLEFEEVTSENTAWDRFRMSPCRTWSECRWVAFGLVLTIDDMVEMGVTRAKAHQVPLNHTELDDATEASDEVASTFKRAWCWEIWDREALEVLYIVPGHTEPLMTLDDPLELENFFPCPRPLYSVRGDSMVPTPEFLLYEELAEELDTITKRIKALTNALKVRGAYDSTSEKLAELLKAPDNEMLPVTNFALLMEKGGLQNAVMFLPIAELAGVLMQLYTARDQTKQAIFEITGMSDIVRGASKASETATAQNIKAQFSELRLGARQQDVQRYARDMMRLKAEIMAEKFEPETLELMTGVAMNDGVLQILRSDALRNFRVDIETDSTIAIDEQADQEAVMKLLTGVVEFGTGMAPLVQGGAISKDAAKSLLMLAVRKFRGSREVEDAINAMGEEGGGDSAQLEQKLGEAMQMVEQIKGQAQEMMQQAEGKIEQLEKQLAAAQARKEEAMQRLAIQSKKVDADIARDDEVATGSMALKREKMEADIARDDEVATGGMVLRRDEVDADIDRDDRTAQSKVAIAAAEGEARSVN